MRPSPDFPRVRWGCLAVRGARCYRMTRRGNITRKVARGCRDPLQSAVMTAPLPHSEQVAANLLKRHGLAAIWQLHLSAAKAYRDGNELAARSILDIADAAERVWLRHSVEDRTGSPLNQGQPDPNS